MRCDAMRCGAVEKLALDDADRAVVAIAAGEGGLCASPESKGGITRLSEMRICGRWCGLLVRRDR